MARKQVIVQLDDRLLRNLDTAAKEAGVSRSELIRRASRMYIDALAEQELDRRHADGYRRFPPGTEWADEYAKLASARETQEAGGEAAAQG